MFRIAADAKRISGRCVPQNASPDQEGIYAPEEIRKPVAFFSKMEMQLSPFLSATFGTFIMQETAEAETDVSLYPSGCPPYLT